MVNYYLSTFKLGRDFDKVPAGGLKFDMVLVRELEGAGYPVVYSQVKFRRYPFLNVFYEREHFAYGIGFGFEHPHDVIIANAMIAIGASLYAPRTVVLPHIETFGFLKYRASGIADTFKDLYLCPMSNRTLAWRKAMEIMGKVYLGKTSVLICYTDKQSELLRKAYPKANVVVLPPGVKDVNLGRKVDKVYDVVIPIAWWKVCLKGFYNAISKLVSFGLRVLVRDYSNSNELRNLTTKAGAHYKGYTDIEEYYLDLASAKVALNVSIYEAFGFRFVESIRVGTPVVSLFNEWLSSIPRLEDLSGVRSFDYDELSTPCNGFGPRYHGLIGGLAVTFNSM